jgi:predicted DNA-binding transcriptional regulator AlpA
MSGVRRRPPRAVGWASSDVNRWLRERLAANGSDPGQVPPDSEFRYLRLPDVERVVGVKRATLYAWVADGRFPRPHVLGAG